MLLLDRRAAELVVPHGRDVHNEVVSERRGVDRVAGYGAWITSPYRRTTLLLAAVVLALFGSRVVQSIGLIGAPHILAGLVCLVAATTPNQGAIGH